MATYTGFFDIAGAVVGPTIGLIVAGVSYQAAFLFTGGMALVSLTLLRVLIGPQWDGPVRIADRHAATVT